MTRYPLTWPDGWHRLPATLRKRGKFNKKVQVRNGDSTWMRSQDLSLVEAAERVFEELDRIGVERQDVIISTNLPTRLDGLPRSGMPEPADPGAAVYWRKQGQGETRCIAIDLYTTVSDNLAAIGATLEALRAIERHGGAQVQERTFRGFQALPAKAGRAWREVLGIRGDGKVTRLEIETAFRLRARQVHPDQGGSDAEMAEVNRARAEAIAEAGR